MSNTLYNSSPGAFGLVQQGMLMPLTVSSIGGTVNTTAQVDTGSTISSVDLGLLQKIGAPVVGTVAISTVQGDSIVPLYRVALTSGGVPLSSNYVDVLGDSLPAPVQALIGRDVLSLYQVDYNGALGSWSMQAEHPINRPSSTTWLILIGAGLAVAGGVALYDAEKTRKVTQALMRRLRRR